MRAMCVNKGRPHLEAGSKRVHKEILYIDSTCHSPHMRCVYKVYIRSIYSH